MLLHRHETALGIDPKLTLESSIFNRLLLLKSNPEHWHKLLKVNLYRNILGSSVELFTLVSLLCIYIVCFFKLKTTLRNYHF